MSLPAQLNELHYIQNVGAIKHYAIAVGAIILLFVLYHWSSIAYFRYRPRQPNALVGRYLQLRREIRRLHNQLVLGARLDKIILYLVYWAVNLIILLTNTDFEFIGKRFDWITVANLTLVVFLSRRNTPLAPMTGNSHEKLRALHKIAGYTTIVSAILHGTRYVSAFARKGLLHKMRDYRNFAGGIAGTAMIILGISTIGWFVRQRYEVFYVIHLTMFMLIIVTVGLHRQEWSVLITKISISIACLWVADRLLRLAKSCWNFVGNYATLTPMPDGGVRIKLQRGLRCTPGSHAFLWIPAVRWMETHHFTLVSNEPAEFVVREYDGFTHALMKVAREQPGKMFRCSIDGGYGQFPNFGNFDRVVLVAGGIGATFTFAIALDVLKQCAAKNLTRTIEFIWVVRYSDSLNWFPKELQELRASPCVNLMIYVTRAGVSSENASSFETVLEHKDGDKRPSSVEQGKNEHNTAKLRFPGLRKGRPNVTQLVVESMSQCSLEDRIGVAACGPFNLLEATREAVSRKDYDNGPSITFHSEEFSW